MSYSPWTEGETALLVEMKAGNRSLADIAKRVGRPISSVHDRWRWIRMTPEQIQARRDRITAGRNGGQMPPKRDGWTEADKLLLVDLRERQCKSWADISKALGKPSGTVYSKYYYIKNLFIAPRETVGKIDIPKRNEDDWRRRQLLFPRDLTSALMGDPLPGYSALDRA